MNNKRIPALVALGTNAPFGDLSGVALLREALTAISAIGAPVLRVSSAWETAPWPASDQPAYVNAIALIDAGQHTPQALYAVLAAIELQLGRTRAERWGPRTLDLDIVDMDGRAGAFGDIILPHPLAHVRGFVLAPLAEAAPDWRHPITGLSACELLSGLTDQGGRRRLGSIWTLRPEAGRRAVAELPGAD